MKTVSLLKEKRKKKHKTYLGHKQRLSSFGPVLGAIACLQCQVSFSGVRMESTEMFPSHAHRTRDVSKPAASGWSLYK
jgi:hypothetical protein